MKGSNWAAYLLLWVAAATWGGNFVAGRYVHAEVSPLALSLSRWSLALLVIAPFTAAALHRQWPVVRRHWRLLAVLGITGVGLFHYLVYVALFASVLAYVCWNRGVAALGANRAGPAMHLVPLFSAVLAVGLLGERVELYHLIGAVLIFGGLYLTARGADVRGARPKA